MAENYIKIWERDIQIASDFFENEKHLNEFLLNVISYYLGKKNIFRYKIVKKYFQTYRQKMDLVISGRKTGALRNLEHSENELVKDDTLTGVVAGVVIGAVDTPLVGKAKEKEKSKENNNYNFIDNDYENAVNEWLEYKKNKNQKYKDINSIKKIYSHLKNISNGNPVIAQQIIDKAICMNWSGFFKPDPKEFAPSKNIAPNNNTHTHQIKYRWADEGSEMRRFIDKDKAEAYFANQAIGGLIPVFLP